MTRVKHVKYRTCTIGIFVLNKKINKILTYVSSHTRCTNNKLFLLFFFFFFQCRIANKGEKQPSCKLGSLGQLRIFCTFVKRKE